jgi:hypothetical protein
MAMANMTRPTYAANWGNRSRISWGAVLAGVAVALATSILLSLLGAAFGAGWFSPLNATSNELSSYGTGAAIWEIINLALSMAFGGYVASRLSGTHSHLDGELHGLTMWGTTVLFGALLLAHALSGVLGVVGQTASSAVSRAIGDTGTISGAAGINSLVQSLSNSGDPTTMNREQIGAEITNLVRNRRLSGSLSDADRNRLVSLVAAQYGVTNDEAARRVTRMENDVKTSESLLEQRATVAADQAANATATAARALFPALVLGLLGALIGSWIGTRHKRVLHPQPVIHETYPVHHDVGVVHHDVGRPVAFGRVEPSSVSVFDDRDHLVYQYLRGISFPVNKQELLRMARSSGSAGAGLLHSIEDMPEGSYANADEVFRALGSMAH